MRKFEFTLILAALLLLSLASTASAQYWFQSGVRAASSANNNNGASAEIETVAPQSLVTGAMAFWVGETLSNGAFLQIGYTISNQTGNLSTECGSSGCSNFTFVHAGNAEWFYEYFPPGNNSTFFGSTGPDGSAGTNGTFNTYSFYSLGNTWYFLFNNKTVGTVNVGAADSGPYSPVALGEVANTSDSTTYMIPVAFANLSAYKYDMFLPVQSAFGVVNYGVGSQTNRPNPYGVQEIGTRTNYFEVGSGIPTSNNNTKLWSLGYRLTVNSTYGNITSRNTYTAYSAQTLYAPAYVNLTDDSRAAFVSWSGKGLGFYSGTQNKVQLLMTANITETANWAIQYKVNVLSSYGTVTGSGWYTNGTHVNYSVANDTVVRGGQEFRFSRWSTNATGMSGSSIVKGPMNISAIWQYRSSLQGTNAYGQNVDVGKFLVGGRQINNTPFLDSGAPTHISGAYYKGVWLAANTNVSEYSPESVQIPLPIYNVTVKTTGIFGLPVNALVELAFKNGSTTSMYSGPDGLAVVQDVPNGYANATASYLWVSDSVVARNGVTASVLLISPLNIAEIAVLVAIFAYVADKSIKREFGRGRRQQQAKPPLKRLWSP